MNKILVQVITVDSPSKSLLNSLSILSKAYPINLKIHRFKKCPNYTGKSDYNKCVKTEIFKNQKYCLHYLLKTNYPYTLILEDDIIWKGNVQKNINYALDFMNKNNHWDIFLLGHLTFYPFLPFNHKIIKLSYPGHAHAMFVNRKFVNIYLNISYNYSPQLHKKKNFSLNLHSDFLVFSKANVYGLLFPIAFQNDTYHFYQEFLFHYFYFFIYILILFLILRISLYPP